MRAHARTRTTRAGPPARTAGAGRVRWMPGSRGQRTFRRDAPDAVRHVLVVHDGTRCEATVTAAAAGGSVGSAGSRTSAGRAFAGARQPARVPPVPLRAE